MAIIKPFDFSKSHYTSHNKEVKKSVTYNAKTKIKNKSINIELKMNEENKIDLNEYGSDYKNRIMSCYEVISKSSSNRLLFL